MPPRDPIVRRLTERVLDWAADVRQDLPWRATRDPWAVLVSELMLQQTQVARVVPKYAAFLARFPTPTACADAAVGDIVTAWAGLGYNRRAVHLHRTAVCVRDDHDGVLPVTLEGLLALPGIGPYTARAVLAFAHERDVGVVDTNAGRVLARAVAGRRLAPTEAQRTADAVVPPGRGWAWNQAILDLGAVVCTKRSPRCGDCPVEDLCAWRTGDPTGPDPAVDSAAVSRPQSTFEGSDRQGRGRLVEALRAGGVPRSDVPAVVGWDDTDRVRRVVDGLVDDGLVVRDGTVLRLA